MMLSLCQRKKAGWVRRAENRAGWGCFSAVVSLPQRSLSLENGGHTGYANTSTLRLKDFAAVAGYFCGGGAFGTHEHPAVF